jgi:hypothetical protein
MYSKWASSAAKAGCVQFKANRFIQQYLNFDNAKEMELANTYGKRTAPRWVWTVHSRLIRVPNPFDSTSITSIATRTDPFVVQLVKQIETKPKPRIQRLTVKRKPLSQRARNWIQHKRRMQQLLAQRRRIYLLRQKRKPKHTKRN